MSHAVAGERPLAALRTHARSSLLRGLLFVFAFFGAEREAAAQITREDSATVLLSAATELEERGDQASAQAVLRLIAERYGDTPQGQLALGRLGDAARTDAAKIRLLESSGGTELRVWSTLYGMSLGVLTPLMFDAGSAKAYGVGMLAGAPLGFLGGTIYANASNPTYGQTRALTWGATMGGLNGWLLVRSINKYRDDERTRGWVLGSVAGLGAGALFRERAIPDGLAESLTHGSLWGLWLSVAIAGMLDADPAAASLAMMGGSTSGLLSGVAFGMLAKPSRKRVRIASLWGLSGAAAGVGVSLLYNPTDRQWLIAPAVGSLIGIGAGLAFTKDAPLQGGNSAPQSAAGPALFNWSNGRLGVSSPTLFPERIMSPVLGRAAVRWKAPLLHIPTGVP